MPLILAALLAAIFASQPHGQEYACEDGEPVLFWIPDELPPAYGECIYVWGYHPMILHEGRLRSFRDVCWSSGSL